MNEPFVEEMMNHWNAESAWSINDEVYLAQKLMFHYALLINPSHSGYEQRYCYKDLALIEKAMKEFVETGKLKYWHKDHTANISVSGSHLYNTGDWQIPENSIGQVEWSV